MTGMNAPQMHRSCSISALGNHFSVIVITISSFDTKLNPSMAGKEIKAVKRNSFLNTASCRALSSGNPGKDGLCNAVYHARNRGMSHAVPLVCLRKVTHFPFRIELTQQDGKQIVIDYGEDIRNDYLTAEPYHLLDGGKVKPEAGSPMREVEVKNRHYGNERDALQCNPPIGESVCRQCDAHNAGDYQT